ncbi:hypothetical protein [Sorangium sp. So ce1099]|uniref:hypothetical protein n=1 Tax=Sorangium sp. So ce1099 TaxID=3133331 RepID=UPI003F5DB5FC
MVEREKESDRQERQETPRKSTKHLFLNRQDAKGREKEELNRQDAKDAKGREKKNFIFSLSLLFLPISSLSSLFLAFLASWRFFPSFSSDRVT